MTRAFRLATLVLTVLAAAVTPAAFSGRGACLWDILVTDD